MCIITYIYIHTHNNNDNNNTTNNDTYNREACARWSSDSRSMPTAELSASTAEACCIYIYIYIYRHTHIYINTRRLAGACAVLALPCFWYSISSY